ncbi:hypothetical protein Tco_0612912 [Tanacetum coccineum]
MHDYVKMVTFAVDDSVGKNLGLNDVNLDYASLEKPLESLVGADLKDATSNSTPTTSESISESVSFLTLLKGYTSRKSMNFCTLVTPARNGADVAVPLDSKDGLDAMLENGPWFIRNNPLILKRWNPDVNLFKEDGVWTRAKPVSNKNGASTSGKRSKLKCLDERYDQLTRTQNSFGKLMFVDDDKNLLDPTVNVDSDSEVEVVFDEATN